MDRHYTDLSMPVAPDPNYSHWAYVVHSVESCRGWLAMVWTRRVADEDRPACVCCLAASRGRTLHPDSPAVCPNTVDARAQQAEVVRHCIRAHNIFAMVVEAEMEPVLEAVWPVPNRHRSRLTRPVVEDESMALNPDCCS
jgi:hypothetical protein